MSRPDGEARTLVHTETPYANPYLQCEQCGTWVTGCHNPDVCGCTGRLWNLPCSHVAGVESVCVTWTREHGCQCRAVLGWISHSEPPAGVLR